MVAYKIGMFIVHFDTSYPIVNCQNNYWSWSKILGLLGNEGWFWKIASREHGSMNKLFSMWMLSWFQRQSPELFCRFQCGQIPGIFRGKDLSDISLVLKQTILSYLKSKNSHSSLLENQKQTNWLHYLKCSAATSSLALLNCFLSQCAKVSQHSLALTRICG